MLALAGAFTTLAASRLELPAPRRMLTGTDPESAVAGRKRGVTNKKVSNRKLKEIAYTFKYPTFREGYAAEIARLRAAGMLRGPAGA